MPARRVGGDVEAGRRRRHVRREGYAVLVSVRVVRHVVAALGAQRRE